MVFGGWGVGGYLCSLLLTAKENDWRDNINLNETSQVMKVCTTGRRYTQQARGVVFWFRKSLPCLVYAGPVWQLDHSSRNDTCLLYTLYGCQGSDRSADSNSLTGSPWLWRADPLRHRTAANVTAKLNGFSCAGTKTNYSNGDQSLSTPPRFLRKILVATTTKG